MLHIPAAECKSKRLIEMPVPDELAVRIDRFIEAYRPCFRNSVLYRHLWLSRNGRPISDSQVFLIVARRTKAAIGHSVNPHLFRDCAITTMAVHHGASIGAGVALLGHRDPRVTQRHYNQADMNSAVCAYQGILDRLAGQSE